MEILGKQLILEYYGCPGELLDAPEGLRDALVGASEEAGATIVGNVFHRFSPHGVSGVVVIAESHVAVHTWPQHGYAAIDIFTCGDPGIALRIHHALKARLNPVSDEIRVVDRGINFNDAAPTPTES